MSGYLLQSEPGLAAFLVCAMRLLQIQECLSRQIQGKAFTRGVAKIKMLTAHRKCLKSLPSRQYHARFID